MTIATTLNRIEYAATSGQTIFPYTFLIFANTDLEVYQEGVKLTLTTHYTVSGVGAAGGGNVTLVTGATLNDEILIVRVMPLTQLVDYVENDPFPAATHETALDRLTMITQQLLETLGRSVKLPVTSPLEDIDLPLPGAGLHLRWNAGGTALETIAVSADGTATPITTIGDIVQGDASGAPERLAVGTAGQHLEVVAGKAAWATPTAFDGEGGVVLNEAGGDFDFRVEGNTNLNMILVDAGQDGLSFGGANVDGAAMTLNNLTDRTMVTSVGAQAHMPTQTQNFDNASGTIAEGGGVVLGIPTWTNDNPTLTITNPATLTILGKPIASTNVSFTNGPYSLRVLGIGAFEDGIQGASNTSWFLGDSTNANMTAGLTINQAGADDEAFALKSSDVAHGLTGVTETDTWLTIKKVSGAEGGARIRALAHGGSIPLSFACYSAENASITKTTSGRAYTEFNTYQISGGAVADMVADGNVFGIRARVSGSDVTCFLVDEDGQPHSVVAATTFDKEDDLQLIEDFDLINDAVANPVDEEWKGFVCDKEQKLIELGVLGGPVVGMPHDNQGMLNMNKLSQLHNGAIRQLYSKHLALEQRLLALEGPNGK